MTVPLEIVPCHEIALACLIRSRVDADALPRALRFAVLDFCFTTLEARAGSLSFHDFMDRLRSATEHCSREDIQTLYTAFQNELKTCDDEDGLHYMMTYFFVVQDAYTPLIPLTPASYLGTFMRRIHLHFKELAFHQLANTTDCFRDWLHNLETRSEMHSVTQDIKSLHGFHAQRVAKLYGMPHPGIDKALERHGNEVTSDVEQSYTQFIAAWKRGDYSTAIESLSRYFDYALGDAGRSSYQYALLNLALLQADFGCIKEALWAIHETIDAARDAKDDVCLNFALSWLSSLSDTRALKDEPGLQALKADTHVIRRAHENRLPKIEAAAYLARSQASSGGLSYVSLLKSQRAILDSDDSLGMDQFLALSTLWQSMDCLPLCDLFLSLACSMHPPDDSAVHAQLLCAMARRLRALGKQEEAVQWLQPEYAASRQHTYHRLLTVQEAVFHIEDKDAADVPLSQEEACLEDLAIKQDPAAAAPRIRRALKRQDLQTAWLSLRTLKTVKQTPHVKSLVLQLECEVWLASSEPERALIPAVQALKHCLDHALIRDYKQAWGSFKSIATKLETG